MKRNILVTSALPYANGPIHLGHLIEYIQSDIWSRYHKLSGQNCWSICADDAHGTPVMISAQKKNITPEEMISITQKEHQQDLAAFGVHFDCYSSTHTDINKDQVYEIYQLLKTSNLIDKKTVEQFYDEEQKIFLPDRFIKGNCPRCDSPEQYGDGCDKCGEIYSPTDLKNPYSVLSKSSPKIRSSEHYFFKLSDPRCISFLREWTTQAVQEEILNKIKEWLGNDEDKPANLTDWDISRDKPYFGFPIPDDPDKFFYVWLDAPIAYISTSHELCKQKGISLQDVWGQNSKYEIYHFIGKDIVYFHALFWPAMLKFSGKKLPTKIFVHGFLTVNREKMSKSRGNFVGANDYISANLNPEWMRYYVAAHSGKSIKDMDISWNEFSNMVNSHLIGKYINIFSRSAGLIDKFEGKLLTHRELVSSDQDLETMLLKMKSIIKEAYESRDFSKVTREVMIAADAINKSIDENKPWSLAKNKSPENDFRLLSCLSVAIRGFVLLTSYLGPIIPQTVKKIEKFILCKEPINMDITDKLADMAIKVSSNREQLMGRITSEHQNIFNSSQTGTKNEK
ncbi:methionine--tRNA ligase [Candidatus Ichthyocystis hellenicum]|uniref:methionine--tRNA ligase n=1 Tax=Candidatus Ichthyocystis hellenicum TaxID=1561003 RepID=UPI000ADAA4B9|nr:methionine--tRNA ligase [Candidatus Ichthyocystis hellenicum]